MRLKILLILLSGFVFLNQARAEELSEGTSVLATKEVKGATRIMISTTGAAKFSSYWLDDSPKLVVEFKSRNIVSKIDNEVIVNQGVIKRITSSYFGRRRNRSLKSLTFELTQKVPYRIWQENDTILLEIQAPLETPAFSVEGEKVFTESEAGDAIIKRLEVMDAALTEIAESQTPPEAESLREQAPLDREAYPTRQAPSEISEAAKVVAEEASVRGTPQPEEYPIVSPTDETTKQRKSKAAMVFLFVKLTLISGLGLLIWRRYRLNIIQELKKLKSALDEKDKHIEQERLVRKTVEQTSLQREKEYQQLKDILVKKGLLQEVLSPEEKQKPWIRGESPERRQYSRLALSRDYNRTIILRIESQNRPESLKSFANNISSNGLCFETKEEFKEKEPLNLRFFFYGDLVPMMKIQAQIAWKKRVEPINYYGVSFDLLEEKDKLELNHYIQSKIGETTTEKA